MSDEKILAEEKLSDEELDNVAGGSISQLISDVEELRAAGFNVPTLGDGSITDYCNNVDFYKKQVKDVFSCANINAAVFVTSELDNQYFYGGEEISREKAMEMVKKIRYSRRANRVKANRYHH